ncbi:aldehyde dehydrogenase family protein [Thermasporomyces composti]|jgi:acyl-CoA reductase-like NAD-dependent aldehyde dehydrogenase|uniref:Acyl-CoA reductase-like NAD-dependent aldehyde dehydrogenase n=1 Tax=Thermasporomyces composti TaxID=696763 RepID=A0A3D9V3E5_THECX|nr:aldehyde dehydrogenase family protein [Thermasporomyces composti]REF36332.1 acyl-CoA reductase-like NAD-dependent aldehyde dehydrogenase [Thermasporomyces composti]
MRTQRLYLDGTWVDGTGSLADGSTRLEVRNPYDDSLVGVAAVASPEQAAAAVGAAARALRRGLPPHRRAEILRRAREEVARRAEEFAQMIRAEAGKPITAARQEVERALTTLDFAAEEARRPPGETVPLDAVPSGEGTLAFTVAQPVGVVAAITPFNFPLNLVAHKVAPALAAGCPVVLKPSERTPLTAGMLVEAFKAAELPPGWLNLVTGDPATIVGRWQEDPRVAVLTFTGSSRVGWQLKAASPYKRHILELGSATAMVIRADADLKAAVNAAVTSGFTFAGQACISLQRLYVEKAVVDEVLHRLVEAAEALPAGDPALEATVVGPLITPEATKRVRSWLDDAVRDGARIVTGGTLTDDGVLRPTVVTDVPASSPLLCEEVFGPVVSVVPVANLDEAIRAVNDSRFGLNTSIYTSDLTSALRYAREAQAGTVLVNRPPAFRADHMPYGGVKESGQGREGVKYAVEELTERKLVILGS